jgi:EAL domain-containing protein (putative c-di-GMP-specific phosphodiesterase class I)
VETAAQRELLAGLGCDAVQGYLTGRPVSADAASQDYV